MMENIHPPLPAPPPMPSLAAERAVEDPLQDHVLDLLAQVEAREPRDGAVRKVGTGLRRAVAGPAHAALSPPSTFSAAPVTQPASGEAR